MALLTETIKYTYSENCENNHKNLELRQRGKMTLIPPNQTNKKIEIKITYLYIHTYYTPTIVLSMKENGNQVLMPFKKETKREPTTLLLLANLLIDHQNL